MVILGVGTIVRDCLRGWFVCVCNILKGVLDFWFCYLYHCIDIYVDNYDANAMTHFASSQTNILWWVTDILLWKYMHSIIYICTHKDWCGNANSTNSRIRVRILARKIGYSMSHITSHIYMIVGIMIWYQLRYW